MSPSPSAARVDYRMGDTLRIWREETVEAEQLVNLLDAGIDAYNLNLVSLLDDGRLVIQSGNGYGEDDPPMLDILKPADAAQLQDRKALTLASLQLAGPPQFLPARCARYRPSCNKTGRLRPRRRG